MTSGANQAKRVTGKHFGCQHQTARVSGNCLILSRTPESYNLGKKHPQKLEELVTRWKKYEKENGVLDLSSGGGR